MCFNAVFKITHCRISFLIFHSEGRATAEKILTMILDLDNFRKGFFSRLHANSFVSLVIIN